MGRSEGQSTSTWSTIAQPENSIPLQKQGDIDDAYLEGITIYGRGQARATLAITDLKSRIAQRIVQVHQAVTANPKDSATALYSLFEFNKKARGVLDVLLKSAPASKAKLLPVASQIEQARQKLISALGKYGIASLDTVKTRYFGDVPIADAMLYFDGKSDIFQLSEDFVSSDKYKAYEAARRSAELKNFRYTIRDLSTRPVREGGLLELHQERLANVQPLEFHGLTTDNYIDRKIGSIDPTVNSKSHFEGFKVSEHFNHKELGLGKNEFMITPSIASGDIGAFRDILKSEIPNEPIESLDDDSRFAPVFSTRTGFGESLLSGADTAALARVYSYRAHDGKLYVYSLNYDWDRHSGRPRILNIEAGQGTQEYKWEEGDKDDRGEVGKWEVSNSKKLFDYLRGDLRDTRRDNIIIIPGRQQATAASIAKNREQVIFPDDLDDNTLRGILNLDLGDQYSQDVDSLLANQVNKLTEQIGQALNELPYFSLTNSAPALSEAEELAIRRDLFGFIDQGRRISASRGSLPGLTISNPDVIFLPTENSAHHRGTLINVSSKEIIAIPNDTKGAIKLFASNEFRKIFTQNISAKDLDSIKRGYDANKRLKDLAKYDVELRSDPGKISYYTKSDDIFTPAERDLFNIWSIKGNISTYMSAVAAGIIDPSDADMSNMASIASTLGTYARAYYDEFSDVPYERLSTIDDLRRATDNPILQDWRDQLTRDWDYEVTSDSEQWWLDTAEKWGPSLRWAGYALSAGLAMIPGVNVLGAVLIGVAMNAVTDLSVDVVTWANTDDPGQKDQLMEQMFNKFLASVASEGALAGLGKAGGAAMSLFEPTLKKMLGGLALKSAKYGDDVADSLEALAKRHPDTLSAGTGQAIRSAIAQFGKNYGAAAAQGQLGILLSTWANTKLDPEVSNSILGQVAIQVLVGALIGGARGGVVKIKRTYQELKAEAKANIRQLGLPKKVADQVEATIDQLTPDQAMHRLRNEGYVSSGDENGFTSSSDGESVPKSVQSFRGKNQQLLNAMRREDLGDGFTPKLIRQWQREVRGVSGVSPDLLRDITTRLNSLQRSDPKSPEGEKYRRELEGYLVQLTNNNPKLASSESVRRIQIAVDNYRPATSDDIDNYVSKRKDELFPIEKKSHGDLSDERVRKMRVRIFKKELRNRKYTKGDLLSNDPGIKSIANRGVDGDQWIGGLMCDKAADELGTPTMYVNKGGANHNIIELGGGRWIDPTWKQFFPSDGNSQTLGKPPIFEGDAAAFRALGMDSKQTETYLEFIKKNKNPHTDASASSENIIPDDGFGGDSRPKERDSYSYDRDVHYHESSYSYDDYD